MADKNHFLNISNIGDGKSGDNKTVQRMVGDKVTYVSEVKDVKDAETGSVVTSIIERKTVTVTGDPIDDNSKVVECADCRRTYIENAGIVWCAICGKRICAHCQFQTSLNLIIGGVSYCFCKEHSGFYLLKIFEKVHELFLGNWVLEKAVSRVVNVKGLREWNTLTKESL